MNTSHASAVVLGACAMVLAVLLAPRTSRAAGHADRAAVVARATHAGVLALLPPGGRHHTAIPVVLCADCAASHTLVRVLLRRRDHGVAVRPMLVVVDRRWPRLDALVQQVRGSQVHERPQLHARVGLTPVALAASPHGRSTRRHRPLVVGVPAVAERLAPLPTPSTHSDARRTR